MVIQTSMFRCRSVFFTVVAGMEVFVFGTCVFVGMAFAPDVACVGLSEQATGLALI